MARWAPTRSARCRAYRWWRQRRRPRRRAWRRGRCARWHRCWSAVLTAPLHDLRREREMTVEEPMVLAWVALSTMEKGGLTLANGEVSSHVTERSKRRACLMSRMKFLIRPGARLASAVSRRPPSARPAAATLGRRHEIAPIHRSLALTTTTVSPLAHGRISRGAIGFRAESSMALTPAGARLGGLARSAWTNLLPVRRPTPAG